MKSKLTEDQLKENMKPGAISLIGFLGNDRREIDQIIADDDDEAQKIGISHKEIAARLRAMSDEGAKGLGDPVDVPPSFTVILESSRGKIPCPFGNCGSFFKVNTTVINNSTGKKLYYSDLSVHLIEEHGFYQGKGSIFRLTPAKIAEVLEII